MIFLSTWDDGEHAPHVRHPGQAGGIATVPLNLIVDDADAAYARVKAAHGEILFEIEDKFYGGRGFTCRDLEGYVWNIGDNDPWRSE